MIRFLKSFKMPHVFVLILGIIFLCSVLTYVIPSGTYERQAVDIQGTSRKVVVPGTYQELPKEIDLRGLILGGDEVEGKARPTSFHGFLMAIPQGLEKSADIVFFIFLIGGVFGILQRSGVITATIHYLLQAFQGKDLFLIILIMTLLSLGGSTLGMGEEFIPLVPIFLFVATRMGYDRIVGVAMVAVAAQVGFAAATTNPFTLGVAKNIAQLPMDSGMSLRLVFFVVCNMIAITYILLYARKIKRDPSCSLVADVPSTIDAGIEVDVFTSRHLATLVVCVGLFAGILYAAKELNWWMAEMSGGFLLMGLLTALICRIPLAESAKAFVKGMEEMIVAALVVGFARGIEVILTNGQILDTLVFQASEVLGHVPRQLAVQGMFLFQTGLNFLIPSGSGQAAVTMPLMAPLADVLGITRQTAVFAFQCGDGFSNTIIPTSGLLMAILALGEVPYGRWLRFMVPLFLILSLTASIFLAVAVWINYT